MRQVKALAVLATSLAVASPAMGQISGSSLNQGRSQVKSGIGKSGPGASRVSNSGLGAGGSSLTRNTMNGGSSKYAAAGKSGSRISAKGAGRYSGSKVRKRTASTYANRIRNSSRTSR